MTASAHELEGLRTGTSLGATWASTAICSCGHVCQSGQHASLQAAESAARALMRSHRKAATAIPDARPD